MQFAHPSMYLKLRLLWELYVISTMYTNVYKSTTHQFPFNFGLFNRFIKSYFINIIQHRVKQNIIDARYGFGSIFHVFVA